MSDFVQLYWKRNRGWPWPEDSWGLTPMFGEDGWCHSCGVPKGPQTGSLVLQGRGMRAGGAWVPYWQFDAICLEQAVAKEAASRFRIELIEVKWHVLPPGEALQIVVPSVGDAWFDPVELRRKAIERHGTAGVTCSGCGTWRWMPLTFEQLPVSSEVLSSPLDAIASPEWFGDGWQAFREILFRRELAELIAEASPRDFKVVEVA